MKFVKYTKKFDSTFLIFIIAKRLTIIARTNVYDGSANLVPSREVENYEYQNNN